MKRMTESQKTNKLKERKERKHKIFMALLKSSASTMTMKRILLPILCLAHLSSSFITPQASLRSTRSSRGLKEDDEADVDLMFPPINIRKESILFGENPATRNNNNSLRLWKTLKDRLPFVVTGARTASTADNNPIGAIYNIVFVRLPVIVAGLVYGKNLAEGHPLIVDVGDGPFTVNSLIVLAVFFVILR
jgi:hypothetical protein